jgi:hypothetical protein
VALVIASAPPRATGPPPPPPRVFAFLSGVGGIERDRLKDVGHRIDVLAPNWHEVDLETGAFSGPGPNLEVSRLARERRVAVWPVVNARGGGRFLRERGARGRLADELVALARGQRYDGLTLDFEGLTPSDREGYVALAAAARRRLRARGRRLAVYVPRPAPSAGDDVYARPRLGRHVDLMLASGYNEHFAGGPPGPVSTRAGFRTVVREAVGHAGRRAVPVVGAFGYRWPGDGGRASLVSSAEAEVLGRRAGRHAPGSFSAGGDRIYYETERAIRARVAAARAGRARWVGLFSLGREPAGLWRGLSTRRR